MLHRFQRIAASAAALRSWKEGPDTLGHQHHPVAPIPYKTVDDPFFLWLRWANPGHYNEGNVYCFDYAMKHLPPGDHPMLEIGTFVGLSTNQITHCKRRHNRANKLFTCDRWQFVHVDPDAPISSSPIRHRDYAPFVRESYLRNARFFSQDQLPATIELHSDEFFAAWDAKQTLPDVFGRTHALGGPLSFAFIDGNHDYDFAKRDFENVDRHLVSGGFILFDDSAPTARNPKGQPFGVSRVMAEVKATGRYEVVIRNPNYLFVKK